MSKYKLTGYPLQLAAECIVTCRKHKTYPRKRVLIKVDSKENGERLAGQLQGIYNPKRIADSDDGWRDFSLVFDSEDKVKSTIEDINGAIRDYLEAHPEVSGYIPDDNQEGSDTPDPDDNDEETDKTDWTTYIIIGAAAAIIIALLIWKE